jgi:hypothetical protein
MEGRGGGEAQGVADPKKVLPVSQTAILFRFQYTNPRLHVDFPIILFEG